MGKISFPSNYKVRQCKDCSNYPTIALISHTSKVKLKILQARLQQYVNCELPDVQAGFRKGRGTRGQIANIRWIMEKARKFTLMAEGEEELNSILIKVKEESEKVGLDINIKKMKMMASAPITSWQIDGFFFWNSLAFLMIHRMLAV